jgi:hypothetical protein
MISVRLNFDEIPRQALELVRDTACILTNMERTNDFFGNLFLLAAGHLEHPNPASAIEFEDFEAAERGSNDAFFLAETYTKHMRESSGDEKLWWGACSLWACALVRRIGCALLQTPEHQKLVASSERRN